MKKKLSIVVAGLLLAVGWISSAQAQRLPGTQAIDAQNRAEVLTAKPQSRLLKKDAPTTAGQATANQRLMDAQAQAPRRTTNFDLNAVTVHPRSWYEGQPLVTWTSNNVSKSAPLTALYDEPDGMIALLKRIYTDKNIPGAKFSAPRMCDLPYQTIEHGWGIIGTNYNDPVLIYVNSSRVYINKIVIYDGRGEVLRTCTPSDTNFPSSWTTTYDGNYWHTTASDGGGVSLPAEWLQNDYGYAEVVVYCEPQSASYNGVQISLGNDTYDYTTMTLTYDTDYYSSLDYIFPGTITPPDDNGYTILLVRLKDGINTGENDKAPEYTATTEELRNYFNTYIQDIQLLTDGIRVGNGGENPGTMFAYTGDLNRFFLLGKGKMFYYSTIDGLNYDRAPFYSMYEEFSPVADNDSLGFNDFYVRMRNQEVFPVQHDCMGVNFRQHYFAMSGKQGATTYPINNLVFFVPDYRGIEGSDYRNYDPEHQPQIGMYVIKLNATAEPDDEGQNEYKSIVTWDSNLDDIAGQHVEQSYMLYRIEIDTITGLSDTTCLTQTAITDTMFVDHDRKQRDSSYRITYFVVGSPTGANNPDFKAQSNDDDVIIPGLNDFIGLDARYESDYEVTDEKNYYRNYLLPKNLDELGQAGITAENVGADGRTLILKRDGVIIAYLDLMMDGGKAYYRIRYVNTADSNTNNTNN